MRNSFVGIGRSLGEVPGRVALAMRRLRSVLDECELFVDFLGVAVADDLLQERRVVEDEVPKRPQ
jgi:hypothetical protein